jgi:hypothetical protein
MEITLKGNTFTTPHTNAEALSILAHAVLEQKTKSDFAASLIQQHNRRRSLSANQWPWVHKMVFDLENPRTAPAAEEGINLSEIVALMDRAFDEGKGLKNPKITIQIEGIEFKLSRAGDRSKAPGTVNVTDMGGWGDNVWYGRILRDGGLQSSRNVTPGVKDRLVVLNGDPVGFAAAHGKLTGACCFCHSPLKTAESTEVGYGPVCAKNWGLPWGVKTLEFAG